MFHFPGCPPMNLWIQFMVTGHYPSRVPPFGDLRIKAHLRLPEAFRSLSRPSSAISAMASTLRSYSLDLCLLSLIRLLRLKRTTESIMSDSFPLCLFRLFLCSFQGALRALPGPFSKIRGFLRRSLGDPSKRYRVLRRRNSRSPDVLPAFRLSFQTVFYYDPL